MRIGKHLFVIKLPLFRKEGVGGDLTTATYLKLPLYKRVFFMTLVLMILLGIYLLELRTESIYLPLKSPLFRKEGAGGDLTIATYLNESPQTPLYERGAFYELLLILYWEYFKEELRTESVYLLLSSPLFRKEGAGGDSLLQLIQNQFPHHFNMCFFSIQCRDVVIRHTTVI